MSGLACHRDHAMLRLPFAAAVLALAVLPSPAAAQDADITLTFETGARTGAVMVALYDSEAAWSGGAPVAQMRIDAAVPAPVAVFRGLPAGTYGAKAFHDVDGDGELDTNPFGIPTEPYAFSNNAVANMGPPEWEQARFAVEGPTVQTLQLR